MRSHKLRERPPKRGFSKSFPGSPAARAFALAPCILANHVNVIRKELFGEPRPLPLRRPHAGDVPILPPHASPTQPLSQEMETLSLERLPPLRLCAEGGPNVPRFLTNARRSRKTRERCPRRAPSESFLAFPTAHTLPLTPCLLTNNVNIIRDELCPGASSGLQLPTPSHPRHELAQTR